MRLSDVRISRRAVWTFSLLGLFILFDLALFGWLIFRSLSEREIQRVLLDTREQAQGLAEQIADRASVGGRDLFDAVASEQETLSYIDSILQQRDVVTDKAVVDGELDELADCRCAISNDPRCGRVAVDRHRRAVFGQVCEPLAVSARLGGDRAVLDRDRLKIG